MFTFGDWTGLLFFESKRFKLQHYQTTENSTLVVSKVMEENAYVAVAIEKTAGTAVGDNGVPTQMTNISKFPDFRENIKRKFNDFSSHPTAGLW